MEEQKEQFGQLVKEIDVPLPNPYNLPNANPCRAHLHIYWHTRVVQACPLPTLFLSFPRAPRESHFLA